MRKQNCVVHGKQAASGKRNQHGDTVIIKTKRLGDANEVRVIMVCMQNK